MLLSGVVYTAHDAAHARMMELLDKGESCRSRLRVLPFTTSALRRSAQAVLLVPLAPPPAAAWTPTPRACWTWGWPV